jgi:phenylacetate-coenzyme A ligase PaaK-like adenylate-forming protein
LDVSSGWCWQTGLSAFEVWASSCLPASVLLERQAARVAALLRWALRQSPLYREIAADRASDSLQLSDFPVMTKRRLMDRFDDWVTDPALRLAALREFVADRDRIGDDYLGRYQVWESSGSTGEPGLFVQDSQALSVYDALEALRRPVLQPLRRCLDPWGATERLAFVGATTGHFASTASIRRLCRISPWMSRTVCTLSFLMPVRELVAALNRHRPTVLATYPSAALVLAAEAKAGRLRVPLQEVWTGGEALTPAMRRFIASSFGCAVSQSYGASEFLAMGSECNLGRLHLNSDWLVLEPVDEHHRPVPPGVLGHTTLLTNLANRVQPLIRYDLGDRVRLLSVPCACGSALPLIEVEGRVDDLLKLDNDLGAPVSLLPLALTTVLEDDAGVFDFQLQRRDARSLWLCVAAEGPSGAATLARALAALRPFLIAQGLGGVTLGGSFGDRGLPGRSGKRARVLADAPRRSRGHAATPRGLTQPA